MNSKSVNYINRDGVSIAYYHSPALSPITVLFMPNWTMYHSDVWRPQIEYFQDKVNVCTFDGRGNGKSDKPRDFNAYGTQEFVLDAIGVLDACGIEKAIIVGWSIGAHHAAVLASNHPDRVMGLVMLSPWAPFARSEQGTMATSFTKRHEKPVGWQKFNLEYLCSSYPDFVDFFCDEILPENVPASVKALAREIALNTDGLTLANAALARGVHGYESANSYLEIQCPTLIIHGKDDPIIPVETAILIQRLSSAKMVLLDNVKHMPSFSSPAVINEYLRDFFFRAFLWKLGNQDETVSNSVLSNLLQSHSSKLDEISLPEQCNECRLDVACNAFSVCLKDFFEGDTVNNNLPTKI